jgi:hypothetical protein
LALAVEASEANDFAGGKFQGDAVQDVVPGQVFYF